MAELSLPVIDLAPLSNPHEDHASNEQLATQLGRAFEGEGFVSLINTPLTFTHEQVFGLARNFFQLSEAEKVHLPKKTFRKEAYLSWSPILLSFLSYLNH